ncbi:DUF2946 family protein [Salegentibacter sp. HM20]
MKIYIALIFAIIFMGSGVMNSVHSLTHDSAQGEVEKTSNFASDLNDCDLCDFHFTTFELPPENTWIVYPPFEAIAYNISLTASVNPEAASYFALRAPPVVI